MTRDRQIFDIGFRAAIGYGDNHHHHKGAQADKVFAAAMAEIDGNKPDPNREHREKLIDEMFGPNVTPEKFAPPPSSEPKERLGGEDACPYCGAEIDKDSPGAKFYECGTWSLGGQSSFCKVVQEKQSSTQRVAELESQNRELAEHMLAAGKAWKARFQDAEAALASKTCQKCHVDGYWFHATKQAENERDAHAAQIQSLTAERDRWAASQTELLTQLSAATEKAFALERYCGLNYLQSDYPTVDAMRKELEFVKGELAAANKRFAALPDKYGDTRMTIGQLIEKLTAAKDSGEFCDIIDREFLFGAHGQWFTRDCPPHQLLRDIRGLVWAVVQQLSAAQSKLGAEGGGETIYRCGTCGSKLTPVRPGKHQCDNPSCPTNNEA